MTTGRFSAQAWETLAANEQEVVTAAAVTGQVQFGSVIALPLVAGARILGRKTVEYMLSNQLSPEVKNLDLKTLLEPRFVQDALKRGVTP